ncbi:hypothetical protein GOA55_13705 [Sinorhizobium meliloti]|nr:hypothetical protein [Sinorhizobium meliloti]
MNRFIINLTAAIALAFDSAHAGTISIGESAGWSVAYESERSTCIAAPKSLEGLFFFQYPDGLQLVFGSKRLSWVEDEKQYQVTVRTDGRGWRGQMLGFSGGNASYGLRLIGPADEFIRALGAAGRFRIEVEGVSYGPYSLKGSSKALALLDECAKKRDAGAYEPEKPIDLPFRGLREWTHDDYGKTFRGEQWTAELQNQENIDGTSTVYLKIAYDGKYSDVLKLEGAGAERSGFGYLGVFPLGGSRPSLVFGSYSGGAHCCTEAVAALAENGAIKQVPIGSFDGEGLSVSDLDDDSIFEISTVDQRFLYSFGGYAGSLPPPRILSLREGEFSDVTKESRFQKYLRSELIKTLAASENSNGSTDGQIAGLLAAAANVGAYHQVLRGLPPSALGRKPDEIGRTCGPPDCKSGREFNTLIESVETRLAAWGYEIDVHLNQPAVAFFTRLTSAKGFGSPEATYENSCTNVPTTFEFSADRYVSMSGYEMGCEFSQITTIDDAALAVGLCSGEGTYWWSNYYFKPYPGGLKMVSWSNDLTEILSSELSDSNGLQECK